MRNFVDPLTGQVQMPTEEESFRAACPTAVRQHITGLLPGFHALAYSDLLTADAQATEARLLFHQVLELEAVKANLTVWSQYALLT